MKVKWQFFFEYEDLKFENAHNFVVPVSKEGAEAFGLPPHEFEAAVTIEPRQQRPASIKQTGTVHITLPGRGEETEDLACSIAGSLAEHVTFTQGRMTINRGLISNQLLPETPEEEAEVGHGPCSLFLRLRTVPERTPFDGSLLEKVTNNALLRQFNAANDARSPIDRFIGLFKILEDLYGGWPIKKALCDSKELWEIARGCLKTSKANSMVKISVAEFEQLIDEFVNTRHQCAHLRSAVGFGISYSDIKVQSTVVPLLNPLEALARAAVRKKLDTHEIHEVVVG